MEQKGPRWGAFSTTPLQWKLEIHGRRAFPCLRFKGSGVFDSELQTGCHALTWLWLAVPGTPQPTYVCTYIMYLGTCLVQYITYLPRPVTAVPPAAGRKLLLSVVDCCFLLLLHQVSTWHPKHVLESVSCTRVFDDNHETLDTQFTLRWIDSFVLSIQVELHQRLPISFKHLFKT